MTPFMTALELAAVYFLIILLYKNDNMTHTVLKTALGIIVIAEMAFSYGGNLSKIGKTSNSYEKTSIGKYESAEDYIRNTYGKDSKISVFIDGENISTPLTNMTLTALTCKTPTGKAAPCPSSRRASAAMR